MAATCNSSQMSTTTKGHKTTKVLQNKGPVVYK